MPFGIFSELAAKKPNRFCGLPPFRLNLPPYLPCKCYHLTCTYYFNHNRKISQPSSGEAHFDAPCISTIFVDFHYKVRQYTYWQICRNRVEWSHLEPQIEVGNIYWIWYTLNLDCNQRNIWKARGMQPKGCKWKLRDVS